MSIAPSLAGSQFRIARPEIFNRVPHGFHGIAGFKLELGASFRRIGIPVKRGHADRLVIQFERAADERQQTPRRARHEKRRAEGR